MKKYVLSIILIISAFYVSAVEFGGSVYNNTEFSGKSSDLKLHQQNLGSLWFRVPFNQDGTSYFSTQGTYMFKKDCDAELTVNSVNLDSMKFVFGNDVLNLSIGRFDSSDFSGLIYNQVGDGISFGYEGSAVSTSLFGCYTGLLNNQFVSIIDDEAEVDEEAFYDTAAKYIVGGASISALNILGGQVISAQFLGTVKLEDTSYNRMYVGLSSNGSISSFIYYDLSSYLSFVSFDEEDYKMGNLTKIKISLGLDSLNSELILNGTYASGDQGPFDAFQGFTSFTAVNSMEEPEYSGLIKTGMGISVNPYKCLVLQANGDVIFDAQEEIEYSGIQYDAEFGWQIKSDVYLGASITQYFDKDVSDNDKTSVRIDVLITF